MTQKIKIYGFPLSGHAHRIELFASLAKIPFEKITINLAAGEQRQEAFLVKNPFGQVPAIEDGDLVLADSNAILVYLAKTYAPEWLPEDPMRAAEIQRFLSLAAGELRYGPATARLMTVFGATADEGKVFETSKWMFGRLEKHLVSRDWTVGDKPSIADVALYTYTAHAPEGNVDLDPYPNIQSWLKRIEALPDFIPMQSTKVGLAA